MHIYAMHVLRLSTNMLSSKFTQAKSLQWNYYEQ
jgi:hypothetical protein